MNTRYDIAAANAREAIEELRLAAYEQGYKDAVNDLKQTAPVSKELTRDEVIEMAKRIVSHTLGEYDSFNITIGEYNNQAVKAKFIINREKRTIVALIYGYYSGNLYKKGIAKCDPEDCFNVHIGKAIALHRALGLEVPKEYLNAPQPTEVHEGDIVKWNDVYGRVYEITKIHGKNCYTFKNVKLETVFPNMRYENLLNASTIIDDSREGE